MERGVTALTPASAARMGQLWAARRVSHYTGDRSLLLDALTLPLAPPGPTPAVVQRRRLAWLRALHRQTV